MIKNVLIVTGIQVAANIVTMTLVGSAGLSSTTGILIGIAGTLVGTYIALGVIK